MGAALNVKGARDFRSADPSILTRCFPPDLYKSIRAVEHVVLADRSSKDIRVAVVTEDALYLLKPSSKPRLPDPVLFDHVVEIGERSAEANVFADRALGQRSKCIALVERHPAQWTLITWVERSMLYYHLSSAWINLHAMSLDAAAAGRGERMMRRLFEEAVAELTAAEEGEGATEVTASTPAQRGRRWGRTAASSPVDKRGGTLSDATLSARIQTAEELAEAVLHDRRIKELAFTSRSLVSFIAAEVKAMCSACTPTRRFLELRYVLGLLDLLHCALFNSEAVPSRIRVLYSRHQGPEPLLDALLSSCSLRGLRAEAGAGGVPSSGGGGMLGRESDSESGPPRGHRGGGGGGGGDDRKSERAGVGGARGRGRGKGRDRGHDQRARRDGHRARDGRRQQAGPDEEGGDRWSTGGGWEAELGAESGEERRSARRPLRGVRPSARRRAGRRPGRWLEDSDDEEATQEREMDGADSRGEGGRFQRLRDRRRRREGGGHTRVDESDDGEDVEDADGGDGDDAKDATGEDVWASGGRGSGGSPHRPHRAPMSPSRRLSLLVTPQRPGTAGGTEEMHDTAPALRLPPRGGDRATPTSPGTVRRRGARVRVDSVLGMAPTPMGLRFSVLLDDRVVRRVANEVREEGAGRPGARGVEPGDAGAADSDEESWVESEGDEAGGQRGLPSCMDLAECIAALQGSLLQLLVEVDVHARLLEGAGLLDETGKLAAASQGGVPLPATPLAAPAAAAAALRRGGSRRAPPTRGASQRAALRADFGEASPSAPPDTPAATPVPLPSEAAPLLGQLCARAVFQRRLVSLARVMVRSLQLTSSAGAEGALWAFDIAQLLQAACDESRACLRALREGISSTFRFSLLQASFYKSLRLDDFFVQQTLRILGDLVPAVTGSQLPRSR